MTHWYDPVDAFVDGVIVRSSNPSVNNSILMLEMAPLNVHTIVSVLPRMTSEEGLSVTELIAGAAVTATKSDLPVAAVGEGATK
jgi:hypothetical protein